MYRVILQVTETSDDLTFSSHSSEGNEGNFAVHDEDVHVRLNKILKAPYEFIVCFCN